MLSYNKKDLLEERAGACDYTIDFIDEDGETSLTFSSEDTNSEVDINPNDGQSVEFSEYADEKIKAICLFGQKLTIEEAEKIATELNQAAELLRYIVREAESYEENKNSRQYGNGSEEDDYDY